MRTRLMIMAIVFAAVTGAIGVVALLVLTLDGWGWPSVRLEQP